MAAPNFNAKFTALNKKSSSCSPVVIFSWATILLWVGFLAYCVHYGLITPDQITGMVENAELLEKNTLSKVENLRHRLVPRSVEDLPVAPAEDHSQDVYVVFSTDCTPYQDWQSLVLFHSAKLVKQKGVITRIASGCDEEKQQQLSKLYKELHGDYCTVHFTPDFKKDEKTKKSYDFYNKPWGLKHWLENAKVPPHALIALLDPDMIFLRPITHQISSLPHIVSKRIPKSEVVENITQGFPVAQTYGLGAPWAREQHRHFDKYKICGKESPCVEPDEKFAELHYSVGPPYVIVKEDFVRIAQSWTRLVPRVYEDYPYLLAEMYAYSMASAHERLPHLQVEHYMVSNVESGGEGWPWVDDLPQVCIPSVDNVYYPDRNVPTVAHFCQTYRVGEFIFTKRRVPKNIFDCDHPLLQEVPSSVIENNFFFKNGNKEEFKNAKMKKRNAFMVCVLYEAVNKALIDYKHKMCQGKSTSYDKTFALHG